MKHLFILCLFAHAQNVDFKMKFNPKTKMMVPENYGIIVRHVGTVHKVDAKGKKIKAEKDMPLDIKDSVVTGEKSFAKIKMVDDTVVSLGPHSHFSVNNYKFTTKEKRRAFYDLIQGKMRMHIKRKAKSDSIMIKTGDYSMGVRGTEILANVLPSKKGLRTQIAVISGNVALFKKSSKEPKFQMNPGEIFDSYAEPLIEENNFMPRLGSKIAKYIAEDNDEEPPFLDESLGDELIKSIKAQKQKIKEKRREERKKADHWGPSKNWRELLKDHQNEKDAMELKLMRMRREKPRKCKKVKKCTEESFHEVNGKTVILCNKEEVIFVPAGCVR